MRHRMADLALVVISAAILLGTAVVALIQSN